MPKSSPNYFFLYSITTILFLLFFFINIILIELTDKDTNQIYNRKLQMILNNKNFSNSNRDINSTYIKEKEKKTDDSNPFYYLFGFYIIFIMMSIYMIFIINRSKIKPQHEKKIKSDLFKFLYFANNGSLIVSLIFLSAVYRASGFLPFGIGLVILGIGTFYYVSKIKISCKEILSDDENNTKVKSLINVPCTIINIVQFTYECCRCEYYDIETTTYYTDGTKEKNYYCTSILCCIWNIYCMVVKAITTIFMILAYYIFFGIFWLFWVIAKFIYSKYKNKHDQEEEEKDTEKKSHETNINSKNNHPQDIKENKTLDISFKVNEKYNKDNSNKTKSNNAKAENIINSNIINNEVMNNKNNNLTNNTNKFPDDKINKDININKNPKNYEIKVNPEGLDQSYNSIDRFGKKMQFNKNENINNPSK